MVSAFIRKAMIREFEGNNVITIDLLDEQDSKKTYKLGLTVNIIKPEIEDKGKTPMAVTKSEKVSAAIEYISLFGEVKVLFGQKMSNIDVERLNNSDLEMYIKPYN